MKSIRHLVSKRPWAQTTSLPYRGAGSQALLPSRQTLQHPQHQQQPTRSFQSASEYKEWRQRIQESALRVSQSSTSTTPHNDSASSETMIPLELSMAAPFLQSVAPMADQLLLEGFPTTSIPSSTSPKASFLQCTYPLESNEMLRNSVTDFSHWSAFRLGKFYELVDALTADVAYRHAASGASDDQVTLVTAGHYHSRKYARTDLHKDILFRCYVTQVGRSSLEIRTDVWQEDQLVNVCHTIMVALDPETGKPLSKVGMQLPPLDIISKDETDRLALAEQHQRIRQERAGTAMQLRMAVSAPPTYEEMRALHQLHRGRALQREGKSITTKQEQGGDQPVTYSIPLPTVDDYTFRSSTVIFPEQRNVHGKLFGGFVMSEGHSLAQYTASFFAQGKPIVSLGIDEAIFLQPVSLGDMVTFTARLVHATACTCRVMVTVEVRDPSNPSQVPVRSNRLLVVFGGDFSDRPGIIPETYQEILMHMDARRRRQVEGPFAEDVQPILQETADAAADNTLDS